MQIWKFYHSLKKIKKILFEKIYSQNMLKTCQLQSYIFKDLWSWSTFYEDQNNL